MNVQVFLEWFHRLDAFVVGIALVVMAVTTTICRRQLPQWLPWLAAGLMVLVAMQGGLGALTVTRLLPSGVVTAHLALALTLVALLSGLTQRLLHPAAVTAPLWWRISALLGLVSVFVQCLLGGRMATAWAGQRCLAGGEACHLVLSHRVTAMPVAVVVLAFAGAALLTGGWARRQWPWLGGAVLLVLVQVALGVLTLRLGLSQPAVTIAHQLVAALLIALMAALLVRSPDRPSPPRSVVLNDTSLEACHG
jgi:cytochrome c oxidase assembly protein subunit 15